MISTKNDIDKGTIFQISEQRSDVTYDDLKKIVKVNVCTYEQMAVLANYKPNKIRNDEGYGRKLNTCYPFACEYNKGPKMILLDSLAREYLCEAYGIGD